MIHKLSTKAGKLLTLSVVLYVSSFFLPFLDGETGGEFFLEGAEIFLKGKLRPNVWLPFAALYVPLLSFPFFVLHCWKQAVYSKKSVLVSMTVLVLPQLIVLFFVLGNEPIKFFFEREIIGYAVWFLALLLLTLAFYYKEKPRDQEEDFSEHLIEEDQP